MSDTPNVPEIPHFSDEDIAAYEKAEAEDLARLQRTLGWKWFKFRHHIRLFLITGNPRWLLFRPIFKPTR